MRDGLPLLIEVRRGEIVEASHYGAIIAAEPDGLVVARTGPESLITTTRSAIKPIQAIPVITSGAADHFRISDRELAVMCGSHDGQPIHTDAVQSILARIGLDESALMCGPQRPYGEEIARRLERAGMPFTQLHNNCSGNHAGMLAVAVHLKLPVENYISPDHPVQQQIISTLTRIAGLDGDLPIAIDGCSAPTFGVPLKSLAVAFARLVNPNSKWTPLDDARPSPSGSSGPGPEEAEALRRIVSAMTDHPEMVEGTSGLLDTDLMRATGGAVVAKASAKGGYAMGILPCEKFPRGLGVAIKIEDGSKEAIEPVVIETLVQLGALGEKEQDDLAEYRRRDMKNHRGLVVGGMRTTFSLEVSR